MTATQTSAASLKRELQFVVKVNGRIVAAFTHPGDAGDFAKIKQASRTDLSYTIEYNGPKGV